MPELTLDHYADKSVADRYAEDLALFKSAFNKEKGLVPQAAMQEILGVSRQRVWQLEKQYLWKKYKFFGKAWYSRIQMEDFTNTFRPNGRPSLSKVVSDCLSDA